MNFQYKIFYIDEKERWIFLNSNDSWDLEEPDSFVYFVKRIQSAVNGSIKKVGIFQYMIDGDGIGLTYQWDDLFGITVIYPENVEKETALQFLSPFLNDF